MKKQKLLAVAIQIAATAHMEQFDKQGKAYILHPLHLMHQFLFDTELAIIAVLHDVLEDSDVSLEYLQSFGFSDRVLSALVLLTHKDSEDYDKYIEGICTNIDAIKVKRKDLKHNSDITRLKGVRPKDFERIAKYHKAFARLTKAKHEYYTKEK